MKISKLQAIPFPFYIRYGDKFNPNLFEDMQGVTLTPEEVSEVKLRAFLLKEGELLEVCS